MPYTNPVDEVLDAMRDLSNESDLWRLSDALLKAVPTGTRGIDEIIDRAGAAGVLGNLTVNTLRLYRTTAKRWPADKRLPNVSFSAHRMAQGLEGDSTAQRKLLEDLAKKHGASNVSVSIVRTAVKAANGTTTAKAPAKAKGNTVDVLADLMSGAKKLLDAVKKQSLNTDQLDKLHSGLDKVTAEVEQQQVKAARRAQSAKRKARAATPVTPATKPVATPKRPASTNGKKKVGIRDL